MVCASDERLLADPTRTTSYGEPMAVNQAPLPVAGFRGAFLPKPELSAEPRQLLAGFRGALALRKKHSAEARHPGQGHPTPFATRWPAGYASPARVQVRAGG
jgi:hypothetical protein